LVLLSLAHQAFRMPEVVDLIRSISRGIVLQLNVTTLTPFAKVNQVPALHSARMRVGGGGGRGGGGHGPGPPPPRVARRPPAT
jgi:hypothetical protein